MHRAWAALHNLRRVGASPDLRVKPNLEASNLWVRHVSERNAELWLRKACGRAHVLDHSFAGSISAKLLCGCMVAGKPSVHLRNADREYFINETKPFDPRSALEAPTPQKLLTVQSLVSITILNSYYRILHYVQIRDYRPGIVMD